MEENTDSNTKAIKVRMNIALEEEVYEKLRQSAFDDRTSMSAIVENALREEFSKQKEEVVSG